MTFLGQCGFSRAGVGPELDTRNDPIIGHWEWTMAMGPMRKQVTMEVAEKEGKLVAIAVTPDGKTIESKDFVCKDDRIQFSLRIEEGGKTMTMAFDGKQKGDRILGTTKLSGGGFGMNLKWDATRVVKKPVKP